MAITHPVSGDLGCKVVYYGPAASGKTTNLKYVYGRLDPAARGKLIAPTDGPERTLFFDFLPVVLAEGEDLADNVCREAQVRDGCDGCNLVLGRGVDILANGADIVGDLPGQDVLSPSHGGIRAVIDVLDGGCLGILSLLGSDLAVVGQVGWGENVFGANIACV